MKQTAVLTAIAVLGASVCLARPGGPGPGPHGGPSMHRPAPHHHPHGSVWGRGGCNFWPGFVGGVIGGAVARTIVEPAPVVVAAPAVVTQPVVVQQTTATPITRVQNVWVDGRYVEQVQANGTVICVWQPGHYEQQTVVVR